MTEKQKPILRVVPRENGETLYGIEHPSFARRIKNARGEPESPKTMYKTSKKGKVNYFNSTWPSNYSMSGHIISRNPSESDITLHWPNGKMAIIKGDSSYAIVDPSGAKQRIPASPKNAEAIKKMIEDHGWQSHASPTKSYTLNDKHFLDFGVPAENWSLPETHPLANIGLEI